MHKPIFGLPFRCDDELPDMSEADSGSGGDESVATDCGGVN